MTEADQLSCWLRSPWIWRNGVGALLPVRWSVKTERKKQKGFVSRRTDTGGDRDRERLCVVLSVFWCLDLSLSLH